jgi:adenylylsulfate kinase-like enzyme
VRILWLYGPPAVGKSVTAWELLNAIAARDPATGYVDIDQLGMLHAEDDEVDDDPEGHQLKGRALAAVAAEFARHGVRTLVVSGVTGLELTDFYAEELGEFEPVFVRLTAPYAELRRRLSARGVYAEEWAGVEEYARSLDAANLDRPVIQSGPGAPAEAAAQILELVAPLLADDRKPRAVVTPAAYSTSGHGRGVLIGGTTAVGKSTIGWHVFKATQQEGLPSAFVDLRQLGFVGVDGGSIDHQLQARAASALWQVFRSHGAQLLILNGPVNCSAELRTYRAAFGATHLNAIRLTAERSELLKRVQARMCGEMAPLAGDSLVGRPWAEADAIADAALHLQSAVGTEDDFPSLDTTRLAPAESAQRVLAGGETRCDELT